MASAIANGNAFMLILWLRNFRFVFIANVDTNTEQLDTPTVQRWH
jgi:hypothetical protein